MAPGLMGTPLVSDLRFDGVGSMIEPPDKSPLRILSGLFSGTESDDDEIDTIEPPDDPKRGILSTVFSTIVTSPPHICSSF